MGGGNVGRRESEKGDGVRGGVESLRNAKRLQPPKNTESDSTRPTRIAKYNIQTNNTQQMFYSRKRKRETDGM